MNIIYKISRNEIRNLFYSPVAWFLAIAFIIQCAYLYTDSLSKIAVWQDIMLENSPSFKGFPESLTAMILFKSGVFSSVIKNLFLFLPLLTMGLINREVNNGTIKLIHSSPIKISQLVLGKYLAIVLYTLSLLLMFALVLTSAALCIVNVELGVIASGLFAIFLTISAYAAIGLFMSSLTTYQIVSALATFLIIFMLNSIGGLWQQYDFVRELTYFLSVSGRAETMLSGLISTRDVIYFLLIIAMFLGFSLIRMKDTMESKSWFVSLVRYLTVFVIILTVGYVTSLPGMIGYLDTTSNKENTIHPNTQKLLADFGVDEPLEITMYANLFGDGFNRGGKPIHRKAYDTGLWEQYIRFKTNIKLNYVYYYDIMDGDSTLFQTYPKKSLEEIAQMMASGNEVDLSKFLKPEEIRKIVDLKSEKKRGVFMQLKYKDRKTILRTFDDATFWPDEMNVAGAFKRLQQEQMPKVLYSVGNLERSIFRNGEREFYEHSIDPKGRISLLNLGIDSDSINFDKDDIPSGISSVIIADPKTSLSAIKKQKIIDYMAKGGNLFFISEPGKQDILNPLLADLGAQISSGTLVELTPNESPNMVNTVYSPGAYALSDLFSFSLKASKEGQAVPPVEQLMPGVAAVLPKDSGNGFSSFPIYETQMSKKAFLKQGLLVIDSIPPVFDPSNGDTKMDSFNTLMGFTRKINNTEQRILVSGDADFMSNLRKGGGMYTVNLISWLDMNRFPVFTLRDSRNDNLLSINNNNAKLQKIVFVYILPSVFAIMAVVILLRRKRK